MDKTSSEYLALRREAESENTSGDRLKELATYVLSSKDALVITASKPHSILLKSSY